MEVYSQTEAQKEVSDYYIALLSGEIIEIKCITSENIDEELDSTFIELESPIYNQRLYEAFKNRELIKSIKRKVTHVNVDNQEIINREFLYDNYYKILEFCTYHSNTSYSYFNLSLKSI